MAGSLTPDWPRRIVALAAAAVALAWATPFSQVAIIAGGARHRPAGCSRRRGSSATSPEPSPVSRRSGVLALAAFVVLLLGPPARARRRRPAGRAVRRVLPVRRAGVRRRPRRPAAAPRDGRRAGLGERRPVPRRLRRRPGRARTAVHVRRVSSAPSPGRRPNGVPGAAIATVAIFLPSFLLIFGALPFWDRLRGSVGVRRALDRDERGRRRDPARGAGHADLDERDHGPGRRRWSPARRSPCC